MSNEITRKTEIDVAKSSTKREDKEASLGRKRSQASMMEKARRSSLEIYEAAAGTSFADLPEHSQGIILDKLSQLENKEHPDARYRKPPEKVGRVMTFRDSLPKVTQSHEATQNIITNTRSIYSMLRDSEHPVASRLDPKALQEITFLVSLANDQCGKGYRRKSETENSDKKLGKRPMKETDDEPDERPKSEIKRELAIYSPFADSGW